MGHIAGSEIFRGSVWIRPTGPALDEIQRVGRRLQDEVGGPGIWPHLSIIGGIEMTRLDAERRLKQLAASFLPFVVKLGQLDGYNDYYRALFAQVDATPELLAIHRRAKELFEQQSRDPYEPHVSLVYGDIDAATKKRLVTELGNVLDVSFQATSLHLVNAASGVPVEQWRSQMECELNYREIAEATQDRKEELRPRTPPQHGRNAPRQR
jgi:2'-5' RNA ligase